MFATTQNNCRQSRAAIRALTNRRQQRSTRWLSLKSIQDVPALIARVVAIVERAFAAFAKIPYQDANMRQEIAQMLDKTELVMRTGGVTNDWTRKYRDHTYERRKSFRKF
jgi:hypothetical protein